MLYGEEPYISVGILTDKKIKFELYGDFSVVGSKDSFSGIYTAELKNDRIVCKSSKHEIVGVNQIEFIPSDPISESFLLRDVVIGSKFHWERKEKQRFIYSLLLLKAGDDIIAINHIPLERYLTSVISSEMSAKSSIELLKAQAVIARSWVLAQIDISEKLIDNKESHETSLELKDELIRWYDREDHNVFDVCADDHCQRFQGVTKIISDASFKAVEQTKGIVLLSGGDVCDARYSKCCGGITESFENVWEPVKHPYLMSVVDYKFEPENFALDFSDEQNTQKWITSNPAAYCNTTDRKILSHILVDYDRETKDFFRWKVEYTQDELSSLIKEKSEIDFGNIIDLVPVERGESARLVKLKIVGTNKTLTVGKELEIRRLLSKTHLYSSAFIVKKIGNNIPEKFVLYGAGWGHGVGLCQIGAAVMAEMGFNFDEILLHYFKNSELKKIY